MIEELKQIREAFGRTIIEFSPERVFHGGKNREDAAANLIIKQARENLVILDALIAKEKKSWQLIKTLDCGCEIRQSNKGHYFADNCAECTNLPKELYETTLSELTCEREEKLINALKEIRRIGVAYLEVYSTEKLYQIAKSTLSELGIK